MRLSVFDVGVEINFHILEGVWGSENTFFANGRIIYYSELDYTVCVPFIKSIEKSSSESDESSIQTGKVCGYGIVRLISTDSLYFPIRLKEK